MSKNHFAIQGHYDLDLRPSDPKINRGHLLVMINLQVKYDDSVINDIGNHLVYQHTDIPTDQHWQTIYPSSLKGDKK